MEYKHEQTTTILRHRNAIRAYRILDIRGDNLVIRNSYNRERAAGIPVPKFVSGYKVGDYADIVYFRTGSTGYKAEVIGHTPPEFTPYNGADIV